MKKRILLTGSEGFIGSIMLPMLQQAGYDVVGLDSCFFAEGNLDNQAKSNYQLIQKDIRDISLEDFKGRDFYGIVHLAGLSNDPLGNLDDNLTYDINHKASVQLAEFAKKAGIERFIFASSCSLYGDGKGKVLDETCSSNPQTAYGKAKIWAEKDIELLANDNFCPTYMRNATAYGFSPRMRFDLVVNSLVGFAKVENTIKILGDGKPWRPLVHIRDIARATIAILGSDRNKVFNQSFNIGSSHENYQIKTIAEYVKKIYPDCEISIQQKDLGDTRDYNVSFDKIKKVLNFDVQVGLDDGILELKQAYERIALNNEIFNHRLYTKLKQIKWLTENKKIDKSLRFI